MSLKSLKIEYDEDYGIDNRSGWSVAINGSYYAQFEKRLIAALVKSFYYRWLWKSD